jgi:hypothetical protein
MENTLTLLSHLITLLHQQQRLFWYTKYKKWGPRRLSVFYLFHFKMQAVKRNCLEQGFFGFYFQNHQMLFRHAIMCAPKNKAHNLIQMKNKEKLNKKTVEKSIPGVLS